MKKGIWTYKELLRPIDEKYRVDLGEGNTPLVKSKYIGPSMGLDHLYFKLEGLNPTGSYKDRFASMAIAHCLQQNKRSILATSSGNTGAALAAYASAAGLKCVICLVDGAPFGKTQQMGAYGAELLMIEEFGINDACTLEVMGLLKDLASSHHSALEISAYKFSPNGMEGVQTIAFEIAEELTAVDHVFVPAGGGGLFLSVVLGFAKWKDKVNPQVQPKLTCVQPAGNDTIASVLSGRQSSPKALANSTTTISGLQVSSLLDADEIIKQAAFSPCDGQVVRDSEVFALQKLLMQKEGIYSEPAGAVSLAGLKAAVDSGQVKRDERIVCLVTGNGFKDQSALNKIYTQQDCRYVQQNENIRTEILRKINNR